MSLITILGLVAGAITTTAFLPQVIKTWQTKSAKDVSLVTLITFIIGVSLWFLYGLLNQDVAIILANGITLILNLMILWLKMRYE